MCIYFAIVHLYNLNNLC